MWLSVVVAYAAPAVEEGFRGMPTYYNAYVCENGHVRHHSVKPARLLRELPDLAPTDPADPFCDECGAPLLDACPDCQSTLRGGKDYESGGGGLERPWPYCYGCGEPLPWTTAALQAIEELAREDDELSDEEVETLLDAAKSLSDESVTPQTTVRIRRFRRIATKLGPDLYSAVIKLGTDIASEAVKKELGV